MAAQGQERRIGVIRNISALPPLATEERTFGIGSFVPEAAVSSRSKTVALFDHLVGAGKQRCRHGDAQHPGSLVVDDQFELGRLHHR
jgi:hypothetical protein